MSWPSGLLQFIWTRLQAVGKDLDGLFYRLGEEPPTRSFGPTPAIGNQDGVADVHVLRMRTCPEPLPTKTKGMKIWIGNAVIIMNFDESYTNNQTILTIFFLLPDWL